MPSLLGIRRRIRSAKNISQITKAMEMVSASKMRRAQSKALATRPFTEKIESVMSRLVGRTSYEHPLSRPKQEVKNVALIIISTNRGLCGGLNVSLFNETLDWIDSQPDNRQYHLITVGARAKNILGLSQATLIARFNDLSENPTFAETRSITKLAIDGFLSNQFDEVYVLYPRFISTLQHQITAKCLLPVQPKISSENIAVTSLYTVEPNPVALLSTLIPYQVEMTFYQMLIEAKASEHSARMIAMKSASDNAKELIGNLTLDYNSARQSQVTNELLDVTTARLALKE